MNEGSFDGSPPSWLRGWSDEALRRRLGAGPFDRGHAYARSHAVLDLSSGDRGRLLLTRVRGSGRAVYQTLVSHEGDGFGGAAAWSGRCSCPVGMDCKHVAAVVLTARDRLPQDGPAPVEPWEAKLADLVREDATPSAAVLGLRVEVVDRKLGYGSMSPVPSRGLRLVPVTVGTSGRWIATGVSWRELEHGYGRVTISRDQREVMLSLLARFRSGQAAYISPYADAQVHLDNLGTGGWGLLRAVEEVGIPLLPGGGQGQGRKAAGGERSGRVVELAPAPATVVLDMCRDDQDSAAHLGVVVRIPGEPDLVPALAPERIGVVGSPAHGLFVDDPGRLLLVPFDRPMDGGASKLLTQAGGVSIPAADLPRFLALYYPALRQRVPVESSDGSVPFPEVLPPRLGLLVRFEPAHRTTLDWSYLYTVGGEDVDVPLVGDAVGAVRDRAAESALLSGLDGLDVMPGLRVDVGPQRRLVPHARLDGLDTAVFVDKVLPDLMVRDDVVVSVEGTPVDYVESTEPPLISVSVSDSPDADRTDWFDLGITVAVAGQTVPFAPLFTALARGDEHLILDSGTWFRLDRPELASLQRLIEEARGLEDRPGDGLRVTPWQAGLWEELVSLGVVEQQSERWSRTVGALLSLDELPKPAPPAALDAVLRPYQLDGYHWLCLLWDHGLGGILADDMGLGKTVQALAMAARAVEQGTLSEQTGPLLIVAPTSVVSTWASQATKFCPELRVVTVTETTKRSGRPLAELAVGAHLVVTSYALLRIDEDAYRGLTWSGLVLDEAQFVKNHQAKTYQCARRLPAPFKLGITGTPLENSLMDLWSLLSITAPGLFPSPQRFTEFYRKPIEAGLEPERLATLRRRIRPLMLRRTKEQVATDLPPKIEEVLEVTLNPRHRRIYDKYLQRERQRVLGLIDDMNGNRMAIFRSLTVLRQLSLDVSLVDAEHAGNVRSSKIDALMEQLGEVVAEGHRALVFSQFTGFLGLVRERLRAEGIAHCYLDGRTRDRPRRIAEFTDGTAPVFLISLKAGGFGLTLTEADYVFVLDPWWNPAAEAQAIDRTHRIGQDKKVMVYRLVATGTIEEKVVALQQRKRDLFDRVVDEGAMLGTQLTADDIRGLLEH